MSESKNSFELSTAIQYLEAYGSNATRDWEAVNLSENGIPLTVEEVLNTLRKICAPGEVAQRPIIAMMGTDPSSTTKPVIALFLNGPTSVINALFTEAAYKYLPTILHELKTLNSENAELKNQIKNIQQMKTSQNNIYYHEKDPTLQELEARLAKFEALATKARAELESRDFDDACRTSFLERELAALAPKVK